MYNQQLDSMQEQKIFGSSLKGDERILWSGKPIFKWKSMVAAIPSVLFGIVWMYFTTSFFMSQMMFFQKTNPAHKPPFFDILFDIPFFLAGLAMIFGPLIYSKIWYKNTYYAVTNNRVMMLRTGISKKFGAVHIKSMEEINKHTGTDGVGTIVFGSYPMIAYLGPISESTSPPAFFNIPEVDYVYNMIDKLVDEQQNQSVSKSL
ncbi:MAG: hypothetical protein ACYC27_14530 [Armatimonadota bacterium]